MFGLCIVEAALRGSVLTGIRVWEEVWRTSNRCQLLWKPGNTVSFFQPLARPTQGESICQVSIFKHCKSFRVDYFNFSLSDSSSPSATQYGIFYLFSHRIYRNIRIGKILKCRYAQHRLPRSFKLHHANWMTDTPYRGVVFSNIATPLK